ncbi:MAG: aryl-sulfate sulfotransferase [Ignavibacteriaceae bacterium]|nr:aryl-sulfate sulfotransferase [Ignavibacteriaceae bacterium]
MKSHLSLQKFIVAILSLLLFTAKVIPQQTGISEYQYLSPVPGSEMNSEKTNIIIRYGQAYNSNDIYKGNLIKVTGERSGLHSGQIILAENNRTLLFEPDFPFMEGETVTVKSLRQISTEGNQLIPLLSYNFRIAERDLNKNKSNPKKYLLSEYSNTYNSNNNGFLRPNSYNPVYSVISDSLPEDFPNIEVDSLNNPSPGYIFLAPFINSFNYTGSTYLIITDNYGVPIFYRQFPSSLFDFKKQITGVLTCFYPLAESFLVMDSSYNVIDSISVKNGYGNDPHELLILENNHSLLIGTDWQQVAMDTIVPGGNPNATVIGIIIQEQDENKNVVFQWRSWDHFQITDATYDIDLTDSVIDYVHSNAIEVDSDGNLLLSSRHMDEVTKIDRQTGDIIWRWGGEYCENNQFTFINDPIGFTHQHDIRKLDNGNFTVFDNGNLHSPPFSRFAEYQLDEVNKLAYLVWEYSNEPLSYSFAMGDGRRLPNHNTFIGWGTGTSPAISEVKPNGDVVLFLSLPDTMFNYRGFKFPWKTNLFVTNPDSLVFGNVPLGDSLEMPLEIINNSNQQIEINDVYSRNSVFRVSSTLPIILSPYGTANIAVIFKPEINGTYYDDLHLRWDIEGQRIAQVVPLTGKTATNSGEGEPELTDLYLSQNYPNPFNLGTKIKYQIPKMSHVTIKIFDVLGNEIETLVNEEKPVDTYELTWYAENLPSGVYFYQLKAGDFISTKKMILLK